MGVLRLRMVVDTGVDDALALVAAVLHPGLDLVEVVATGGNVARSQSVANTRFVLGMLGVSAVPVPVTAGAGRRADGLPYAGRAVHGADGLAGLAPRGQPQAAAPPAAPHEHTAARGALLVCLGPLTTLLGWDPGEVAATYARPDEANYALDPAAAARVRGTWHVHDAPAPEDAAAVAQAIDRAADRRARLPATDLGRLVVSLLAHQAARGTGLGDADAVLRLAGESRPVDTLAEILRVWEHMRT